MKVSLNDSTLAAARFNLGKLFQQQGEMALAAAEYRQAEAIYDAMVKAAPDDPETRGNLDNQMNTLLRLGFVSLRLERAAAPAAFRKATEILRQLEQTPPGDKEMPVQLKQGRAAILSSLGMLIVDANPREAREYYLTVLELRRELVELKKTDDARADLAGAYVLVGGTDFALRDNASTQANYQKALDIYAELAKKHPDDRAARKQWGFALQRLGEFYLRTGRPELAAKEYEAARRLYQELVDKDPKRADFQEDLSRAWYDLCMAGSRQGRKDLAAKSFRASLEIREALARGHENDLALQRNLMTSLARCGECRRAEAIAARVREKSPDDRGALFDVACCLAVCAGAVAADKDPAGVTADDRRSREDYAERAVGALREAIKHGYRHVLDIETDPDFDAIADRPDFKALVAELSKSLPQ